MIIAILLSLCLLFGIAALLDWLCLTSMPHIDLLLQIDEVLTHELQLLLIWVWVVAIGKHR